VTVTHGMDTDAGRQAGDEIDQGSQRITELAQQLDTILHGFEWVGTDADRSRDTWQTSGRPALETTAQHLSALAVLLRREADAQDEASGNGGGAGSGGAGSPTPEQGGGLMGFLRGAVGFVGDRINAAAQGLGRMAGHLGDAAGKIVDVLTGQEDHSVSEIAASVIAAGGAGVGAAVGLVTGEDSNWFGEGAGQIGDPQAVPAAGTQGGQYQPALTEPRDLPSLMQSVTDGYQVGSEPGSTGDVRITRVDNGTGTPGYVVSVPGTERWGPDAGPMPRDLSANLNLVAGNPTAAAESVRMAMDAAGIPPGSPVMLVGHSQGGIIAAQLASDPAFVERYGVSHVMTYGAPIDHMQLAPGVQALQVQHGNDVVPRLDLGGVDLFGGHPNDRVPTVTLGSPGGLDPVTNHSHVAYMDSVREARLAQDENGRILRGYEATLSPFLVGPGGSASAIDVPVRRGQ
jgi:pimeloyl-ACP methyl ester carboxylesterase